jgi:MoaA/NifB/PqqE/SkfB family radical SAM enzyme
LNKHDHVTFSIDGWDQESNNKYRVNSNFDSITNGISTLRQNNKDVYITWSTIVFSFNEQHLDRIQDLAQSYKVDNFNIVQSSLFGNQVPNYIDKDLGYDPLQPSDGYESKFSHSARDKRLGFTKRELPDTKWHTQMSEQVFSMSDFDNAPVYPLCLAGDRGLYIDAEGILYPCSWISHPFGQRTSKSGKKILWNDSLFVKHKHEFNLRSKTLDDVLNSSYWNDIVDGWKDPMKTYVECENKCNLKTSLAKINKRFGPRIENVK